LVLLIGQYGVSLVGVIALVLLSLAGLLIVESLRVARWRTATYLPEVQEVQPKS
jgi:hypothetical protein